MRRFLLSCAILAVLVVPAAAAARASASAKPGYLVVRRAVSDGGAHGSPAVILVVREGFVLGRVSQEAKVDVYHLGSAAGQFTPQVKGDVSVTSAPRWNGLPGKQYSGSNFRFRITGGFYRVVVRGSGIYAFAGGRGTVWLQGSSVNRRTDGTYSVDGSPPRSMPTQRVKRQIGRG
jgi:hypothetical protein